MMTWSHRNIVSNSFRFFLWYENYCTKSLLNTPEISELTVVEIPRALLWMLLGALQSTLSWLELPSFVKRKSKNTICKQVNKTLIKYY